MPFSFKRLLLPTKQRTSCSPKSSLDSHSFASFDSSSSEPGSPGLLSSTHIDTPINRLPPELLGLIFDYSGSLNRPGFKPRTQSCPAMIFCQVCRWWRDVAISLPRLWSTFDAYSIGMKTNMALHRLWLERSRGASLEIMFGEDHWHANQIFEAPLALFFSHCDRWADITIHLEPKIHSKLLRLRGENVPILKRIHIRSCGMGVTKDNMCETITLLASFPMLYHISWDLPLTNPSGTLQRFASYTWPNLRRFITEAPLSADECKALLICLPQVEEVFFHNYVSCSGAIASNTITVKTLRYLGISGARAEDVGVLLSSITVPSLRRLNCAVPKDYSSIERLVDRSACTLQSLTIGSAGVNCDIAEYIQLKCFQSIHTIEFSHSGPLRDDVASRITSNADLQNDSKGQILPCLSAIKIHRCKTTDGILASLISSRWKGKYSSAGLKMLEMPYRLFSSRCQPIDSAVLRGLQDEGLQIARLF